MENLIFCEEDDALTVTKDGSNLKVFTNIAKQSLQPNSFLTNICNEHVPSLYGR